MNPHDPIGSGLDRREFLKVFGLTAAATGLVGPAAALAESFENPSSPATAGFPQKLESPPKLKKNPNDENYWRSVRDAFALPNNYIHMNTGTTGSQPAFSLNNLAVYNLYKSQDPKDWQPNLNADFPDLFPLQNGSATTARQQWVADVYGANQDEIVLSYNTTDACNLIFAGTPWQAGDRIITTSFEHPALAGPIAWARDYHGVEVKIIDIPSNFTADIEVDDVLGWFESKLAESEAGKKQYLAFSEVFYKNGLRMPVAELCALAREYGTYTIVDTAHGWGMLPINCHAYGADFIAGAGHKWLCGGPGTGICYVRKSGSYPLPPFALGNFFLYGNLFQTPSSFYENRNWNPGLYMQFRGESNTPALFAMTDTLSFFEQIGIQEIYERGVALGNYLKGRIASQWGPEALWVQQNPDARFATALTAFNPFAAKDSDSSTDYATMVNAINTILANLAAETPKIYIRSVTWRSSQNASADDRVGFRVSTHGVYNDFDEVDHVFERLVYHINASNLLKLNP